MVEILRGKIIADEIRDKAKKKISKMDKPPGMAVILVGDNEASKLYVGLKEKAAKEVGIFIESIKYDSDVSENELIEKIGELNARPDIDGILVQLPLPNHDEDKVVGSIDPKKDIDGFHPINLEKHDRGENCIVPPVSLAIMRLISASNQPLDGKTAVIIGNNPIFSKPLLILLKVAGIEAQFLQKKTSALSAKTRGADIIIVAVGEKDFLKDDMVKDGAIVIDVGTNKDGNRTVGDVAEDGKEKAGFLSPVPGGVGPLTVAYLLTNVIEAAKG